MSLWRILWREGLVANKCQTLAKKFTVVALNTHYATVDSVHLSYSNLALDHITNLISSNDASLFKFRAISSLEIVKTARDLAAKSRGSSPD